MIKKNGSDSYWYWMRNVRIYFNGEMSELSGRSLNGKINQLTGKPECLSYHHVWTVGCGLVGSFFRIPANSNGDFISGRDFYTIWDGQLRKDWEENDFHFLFYGGNNQHSLDLHEENNYRLYLALRRYLSRTKISRELFGPGGRSAAGRWLDFYPEWCREFAQLRRALTDRELVIPRQGYKLERRKEKITHWWCWDKFFFAQAAA